VAQTGIDRPRHRITRHRSPSVYLPVRTPGITLFELEAKGDEVKLLAWGRD
jgi:hypothetical protein